MKKVRPWCGQPSDRGWLRNRTEHCSDCSRFVQAVSDSIHSPTRRNSPVSSRRRRRYKLSNKLELKMFYQTQTARRPPKGPKSVVFLSELCTPITSGSNGMVLSAAAWRYLQRARYNALSMGISAKNPVLCPRWSWLSTLTFKLFPARDQTRRPSEFGVNPFSGSRNISYTNKKVTDSAKNRTLRKIRSSLRAVMSSYNAQSHTHLLQHGKQEAV